MNLGPQFDQPLPGMEHISPAKPHEQTEAQFLNRPDVMVHGRFTPDSLTHHVGMEKQMNVILGSKKGFHSGTEKAAHERLESLQPRWEGTTPRFFHGRVDPERMHNRPPDVSAVHTPPEGQMVEYKGSKSRIHIGANEWRRGDAGDDWERGDHDSYYRNAYEDKGSTSAIHGTDYKIVGEEQVGAAKYRMERPKIRNFETWRTAVSKAVESGENVPHHVRAIYDASGGKRGPHYNLHPEFSVSMENTRPKYGVSDPPLIPRYGA